MSGEASTAKFDLERISRTIAIGSAMVALAVSATSFLDGCTQKDLANRKAFRESVQAEEAFWDRLGNDYLTIYSQKEPQTEEWRNAKVAALLSLAKRPAPGFEEFKAIGYEVEPAKKRIEQMKSDLNDRLEASLPKDTVLELKQLEFRAAALQAVTAAAQEAKSAKAKAAPAIVRTSQVVFDGPDSGWDLDFIWCATPGEAALEQTNYTAALTAANNFANYAASGNNLLPGTGLGRIRLRMTSDSDTSKSYRSTGRWIVQDGGKGEREAAEAARSLLSTRGPLLYRMAVNTGKPTPYYTSIFFCAK